MNPAGKRILSASSDGSLILWEPRSPSPLWKLSPPNGRFNLEGGITALAVNPSSTLAVVGGALGGLRVVNLNKGEIVGALDGHGPEDSVEAITFIELTGVGAGTDLVVTGGTDGRVRIWDLSTMRLRSTSDHAVSDSLLRT